MEKRFEYYAQIAAVSILAIGCVWVLIPFLAALLFAAVVCISTWPAYSWLLGKVQNRKNLAALIMTLFMVLVIILPLALVAYNLADNVTVFYNALKRALESGSLEPPAWLAKVPLAGEALAEYWHHLFTSREEMLALAQRLLEPTKNFLLNGGMMVAQGVLQMSVAAFISFFFYRDGKNVLQAIKAVMNHLAGDNAANVLHIIGSTIRTVMYGQLGTALAQGFVAVIGFSIAHVPAALVLGVITFMVSLIPIGPPLVWGGAAVWLFANDETGWGIFMLLWGVFLISSVDNVLRPFLISHGTSLPFLLVLLGVMGGLAAFGFIGIFIGPTLLAVGYSLAQQWVIDDQEAAKN